MTNDVPRMNTELCISESLGGVGDGGLLGNEVDAYCSFYWTRFPLTRKPFWVASGLNAVETLRLKPDVSKGQDTSVTAGVVAALAVAAFTEKDSLTMFSRIAHTHGIPVEVPTNMPENGQSSRNVPNVFLSKHQCSSCVIEYLCYSMANVNHYPVIPREQTSVTLQPFSARFS